jgi:type I restriction enzyme S subunit
VRLGEVLRHRKEFVVIDDLETYKRCRVQLHAQGIVLRDSVLGAEIRTKRQQVCHFGEFLVAEIDAKVGGFGVVPEKLDGAIVSSHYFLFVIDETKLDRRFLDYFIRTRTFRDQVEAQGSTNYAAIRPADVLGYEIPLPPLQEQRRLVGQIEELIAKIDDTRSLRQQTDNETEAFVTSAARDRLAALPIDPTPLNKWLDPKRDGIQTGPFGAQLSSSEFVDSGCPVLTIGNVQYGGLLTDRLQFVSESKARTLERYQLANGDILFARMGTVGRCCIVPPRAVGWLINYHIIRVALDHSKVEPRFLYWTIRASQDVEEYLGEKIRGATRKGVNSVIMSGLPCRVPPLSEQRNIAAYLDSLQAKVGVLRGIQTETAHELNAILPAFLDRAFKKESAA